MQREIDKDRALCAAIKSPHMTFDEYLRNWNEMFTALPYWMDQYETTKEDLDDAVAEYYKLQQENERLKQELDSWKRLLQKADRNLKGEYPC